MRFSVYVTMLALCCVPLSLNAQDSPTLRTVNTPPWKAQPAVGNVGSAALISLTNNLRFLNSDSTSLFLELNGNPLQLNNYIHSGDVFYAFSDQAEPLRAHTSERISEKVNAPTRNAASIAELFVKASALALIVFEKYPEACLIFGAIIIVAFVWYRRPKQGERW